ncbi:MAG: GTP-dependent dephospho-CoA kinase family protein [Candidatus Bathyarchaeota archaeon]|nr:GTP-dependent dephospho-CoA kinase family protein [Candidatus Bathyarchaeota archaeon]
MNIVYTLTPQLRIFLKEPFGSLIEGTPDQTMAKLKEQINKEKPPMVISVGDVVSKNLHTYGMHPQLTVIDHISLRSKKPLPLEPHGERTVNVKNPQGTITEEAIEAIQETLTKGDHTHIVVDGEEDLLTLVAVLYAPQNAFVVYGQPHVGVVVVRASFEKKAQVEGLLKGMKPAKS